MLHTAHERHQSAAAKRAACQFQRTSESRQQRPRPNSRRATMPLATMSDRSRPYSRRRRRLTRQLRVVRPARGARRVLSNRTALGCLSQCERLIRIYDQARSLAWQGTRERSRGRSTAVSAQRTGPLAPGRRRGHRTGMCERACASFCCILEKQFLLHARTSSGAVPHCGALGPFDTSRARSSQRVGANMAPSCAASTGVSAASSWASPVSSSVRSSACAAPRVCAGSGSGTGGGGASALGPAARLVGGCTSPRPAPALLLPRVARMAATSMPWRCASTRKLSGQSAEIPPVAKASRYLTTDSSVVRRAFHCYSLRTRSVTSRTLAMSTSRSPLPQISA